MTDKRRSALLLIVLSIIFSYLASMTNPGIGNMEMGALLNLYLPGVIAIFTLVIFLLCLFLFKSFFLKHYRIITLLAVSINIATGIYLHYFYKSV